MPLEDMLMSPRFIQNKKNTGSKVMFLNGAASDFKISIFD